MIVYKTTNLINGKIYVGQDIHNNPNYLGSGVLILKAIKKYGKENFKKEVIDFAESLHLLNEKEVYWIKFYNCKVPAGYNLTDGGEGVAGYVFSEQAREKVRMRFKGKPKSVEHKKKCADVRRGKPTSLRGKRKPPLSEETKQKMRKPKSEETKQKMRKPKSEEHKKKIGEASGKSRKGKKRGPYKKVRVDRGQRRGPNKKVRCDKGKKRRKI